MSGYKDLTKQVVDLIYKTMEDEKEVPAEELPTSVLLRANCLPIDYLDGVMKRICKMHESRE
jgi:hypothetical protein